MVLFLFLNLLNKVIKDRNLIDVGDKLTFYIYTFLIYIAVILSFFHMGGDLRVYIHDVSYFSNMIIVILFVLNCIKLEHSQLIVKTILFSIILIISKYVFFMIIGSGSQIGSNIKVAFDSGKNLFPLCMVWLVCISMSFYNSKKIIKSLFFKGILSFK